MYITNLWKCYVLSPLHDVYLKKFLSVSVRFKFVFYMFVKIHKLVI